MIQILLLAFVPLAMAQYSLHGYGGNNDNGYGKNGHYVEEHYAPQPYKFGYDVKDHYGSTLQQKEEGDGHGNKRGSYGYTDGHGIYRQVDYVADKGGFRATIKTNEPGTSDDDSADVHISSDAPRHVEHNEPIYKAQSYSAPSYGYLSSPKSYESRGSSYGGSSYGSSSYESLDRGHNNNNNNGYARSHSIPAVYYAKGY